MNSENETVVRLVNRTQHPVVVKRSPGIVEVIVGDPEKGMSPYARRPVPVQR